MTCLRNRLTIAALSCFGLTLLSPTAEALFIQPQLQQVPIARVVENLEEKVKASPEDAGLRRNLARAHAMAYANKGANVTTGGFRGGDALWFGFTPKHNPFVAQPTDDAEKQKAATEQLKAAIAQYREALKLKPDDAVTTLGLAWVLDEAGEDDEAKKQYRAAMAAAWKSEGQMRGGRMGRNYITAEAGGYLKNLLDADADKQEISEIDERTKKLLSLPTPVTPIAIPLAAGLTEKDIHDRTARVKFDADGTGFRHEWTWLNNKAGWLVYDAAGNGKIDSARQLFGNATFMMFWENGYDALSVLDNDQDGKLAGAELAKLAIWHDANGNGVSEAGEVRPLAAHGIEQLDCSYQVGNDGVMTAPQGVRFHDGTCRATFDVILQPRK